MTGAAQISMTTHSKGTIGTAHTPHVAQVKTMNALLKSEAPSDSRTYLVRDEKQRRTDVQTEDSFLSPRA